MGTRTRTGAIAACAALYAVVSMGACVSMNSLTTARALGKDRWEFTVGLSFAPNFAEGSADLDLPGLPVLDLNARFGLHEQVDLGVRLNSMGWFVVDAKFEAYDNNDNFTFAAKTGIGFSIINAVGGTGLLQFELDALADLHVGADATDPIPEATITIIPKYTLFFGTQGALRHFVGLKLYGRFAADEPSHYVTPFATMLFDVTGGEEAELARVLSIIGNFGVAYTYNDDY